jgi:hypothetical protein
MVGEDSYLTRFKELSDGYELFTEVEYPRSDWARVILVLHPVLEDFPETAEPATLEADTPVVACAVFLRFFDELDDWRVCWTGRPSSDVDELPTWV